MTGQEDSEARRVSPSKAVDPSAEDLLASSSETLARAALTHKNWARAIEADTYLPERLKALAGLPQLAQALDASTFDAITKLTPNVRDSLDSLLTRLTPTAFSSLAPEPRMKLESLIQELASRGPNLDKALLGLSIEDSERLASALPDIRKIQRSLNQLNQPATTARTQEFITGTDSLRYRGARRVWHYTNAQALDQILRRNTLWASSPHHLNDASELRHGVQNVEDAVRRAVESGIESSTQEILREVTADSFISEAMNEVFFISASLADDSLTLWRNYAATDGFAIGLQPGKPLSADGLLLSEVDENSNSNLPPVANWYRVHYKQSQKASVADAFVASAVRDIRAAAPRDHRLVVQELRKHLLVLASTMKHEAFSDEREVRWITTNWAPLGVVHYEVTGRGFVPVLHVRSSRHEGEQNQLPITGLRCSPTTSPTIERTMRGLLKQRLYESAATDVRKSQLPFRG